MQIPGVFTCGTLLLINSTPLPSCTGKHPGVPESVPTPCPASPNCVSSDTGDIVHVTPPLRLIVPPDEGSRTARELVLTLARTRIMNGTTGYLHAECQGALFGFIDDLELDLRPAGSVIAIHSASCPCYSDFGVNRHRVDTLHEAFTRRGVIR